MIYERRRLAGILRDGMEGMEYHSDLNSVNEGCILLVA